jgi:large subunit ribosomal protein L24
MIKTINPGKQRKRAYDAVYHNKKKVLTSPLDKRLFSSTGKKRLVVRKGDTVKVMTGENKGKTGKVEKVDYTKERIFIKDIKHSNIRGQEKLLPFVASNLLITDVVLTDNKRISKKHKKMNTPSTKKVE